MITPASTHQDVTDRGLPYMFRMCGRDDAQAPAAVKFMKEALKAKTIFIVDDKTTYSQGLAEGVAKACKEMGIKVLGYDHVNQGDKDFSAILTMAKREGADILYMSLQNHATGSLMAIQAKRIGLKAQIVSQDAMFHPNFMKVAKAAAEGIFVTYGFTDKTTDAYKLYEKVFTSKYGEIGAYGTYAYDGAIALLKAGFREVSCPQRISIDDRKYDGGVEPEPTGELMVSLVDTIVALPRLRKRSFGG